MTSLAFMAGVLPLALATGAGAPGRIAIGTGVLGGMMSATLLASLFVPVFFVLLQRRSRRPPSAARQSPAAQPKERAKLQPAAAEES
jgi:multidrug efflux pump